MSGGRSCAFCACSLTQKTAKVATTPRMYRVTSSKAMATAESKHRAADAAREDSWEAIAAVAAVETKMYWKTNVSG
ncbi:hypothetical protein EJB05_46531, partial [Eragrostis curvula]